MKDTAFSIREMGTVWQKIQVFLLYYAAFPACERKPFGIILEKRREGKTDIWCFEQDGRFAGFASTINGDGLILIDYLAIRRERRGKGLGSKSLQALREQYAGQGVFVEIESVYEAGEALKEKLKRKRFYLRNGMEELGVLADVFGVRMELLGWDCRLDFDGYQAFYREHYSPWAAEHLSYVEFPGRTI